KGAGSRGSRDGQGRSLPRSHHGFRAGPGSEAPGRPGRGRAGHVGHSPSSRESRVSSVLVDTSVWVDHFRQRNAALVSLLELDLVLVHPLIVGEIACGTPPRRKETLSNLGTLQLSQQAS